MAKKKDKDGDEEMIDDTNSSLDPVERLFGIELETTVHNAETDDEPDKIVKENVLKLSCHIDNNNNPINTLSEGIDISLVGDLEKYSD